MNKSILLLLFLAPLFTIKAQQVDSIIDIRDDKIYRIIKIGQQWWMQENLNIGNRIDGAQDAIDNGVIEKYCNNNLESNCDIYGGLYQWDEMIDYNLSDYGNPGTIRGICPAGWHLPTDNEWIELTDFLGGESVAGGKLKETGEIHWYLPNQGATNSSGFTALPGGSRRSDGSYPSVGLNANFWSSTETDSYHAWCRILDYKDSQVANYSDNKPCGLSVRCLRDSSQFSYLTVLSKNLETISMLNFSYARVSDTIIIINTSAGDTINITSLHNNTPTYNLNKSSAVLTPGDSIHLKIIFSPPVNEINYLDTLRIESDDPYKPVISVPLTGYMPETDSIIDIRDNQVYKIVKTGQQWWIQENLNVGTRIDGSENAADNGVIEKYCYDNSDSLCNIYGGLYQWNEMMDYNPSDIVNPGETQGLCPVGWHLPTDNEWTELTDFLGGEVVAGGKLKEIGEIHWTSPNTGATNESGFTALPGGILSGGYFDDVGSNGTWFSSTETSSVSAWGRYMSSGFSNVERINFDKEPGFSVRCLRDSSKYSYLTVSDTNFKTVSDLNFYGDNVQEKLIMINSSSGEAINISSIYTKNSAYSLNKSSATLSPGDSIHLTITFDPLVKDIYRDTLFVESDDPYNSLITISLNGTFPPEITFTDSTNISCFEYSDGSATVTPSLGTPPYQYQWDDPGNITDSIVTGLQANIYYHVIVTDSLGWSMTDSIILSQPLLLTSQITDSTNISCFGYSDGEAVITPSGGTAPYDFTWDDQAGTTDSTITGLTANQYYDVTITDANGCMVGDYVMLSQPDILSFSVTDSSNISCYGFSDGSATITINGGTRPYTYLWDDPGTTTDSTVTGLQANKYYHVDITDAHECSVQDSVRLSQPDPLATEITEGESIACYDVSDGTAWVTVSGGTKPYIYSWDSPANSTDSMATGLSADIYYHVTVTDAHSCPTVKDSVILSQPPMLVTDITNSTNISCHGFSDGSATVTPSGGTPPYSYHWDDPENTTDSTVTGLSANEYYHVIVIDVLGCSTIDTITLSEPDQLEINPSYSDTICLNSSKGFIITSPSGGTPPYSYLWSNDVTIQELTDLEAGGYSVKVTDSHGCKDSADFTIHSAHPYSNERICIVTIDLASGKNIIVWEKTPDQGIASYNIYRESSIGQYELIGSQPVEELSIFKDETADPESRSFLYKITVTDTCGNESSLSTTLYHKPSFLQYVSAVGGINLSWTDYKIEGISDLGQYLTSYVIYRGTDSAGLAEYQTVGSINNFTDTDPDALARRYYYRVAAVMKNPCIPTGNLKAESGPYSHSMSNIEDNRIKVSTANHAPTDIGLDNNAIDENLPIQTLVGRFSTIDQDIGDSHTFAFVAGAGDSDNGSFAISGDSLLTAEIFDYETKSNYGIRVITTDTGSLSFEKQFTILIINVSEAGENQSPADISVDNNTINEDEPAGSLVGKFTTTDPDAEDTHSYTLVTGTGSEDNINFSISSDSLLTAAIFDFEVKSSYSIRVKTTDSGIGNLYFEKAFTISVNDMVESGITNRNNLDLAIYPNPFSEAAVIEFNNPQGNSYTLFVKDLSGKVCRIVGNINTSEFVLTREGLQEGFYLLELRGSEIYRGKMLIE